MDLLRIAARVAAHRRLPIVAQEQQEQEEQEQEEQEEQGGKEEGGGEGEEPEYGGKGPYNLPDDHVAAGPVPKGGASCANCKFVDVENHACTEPNYVTWNGGDSALPDMPLDEICSDWFVAGAPEGGAPPGPSGPPAGPPAPAQGQAQM